MFLPMELLAKCVGNTVHVVLHGHELRGTLDTFDDHCNLVLSNVTELVDTRPLTAGGSLLPVRDSKRVIVAGRHVQLLVPGGLQ